MPAFFTKPLSATTGKYRIFYEESVHLNPRDEKTDFEELRGKHDSRIYRHGEGVLAVSSDNNRLNYKIRDLLGVPRQPKPVNEWWGKPEPTHLPRAKTGSVVLFADDQLEIVAEAIGAQRKRILSPEQLEKLRTSGEAYRFQKRHGDKGDSGGLKPTIEER